MRKFDIGGGQRTIHSLQNHDELFIGFNFDEKHPDELFMVRLPTALFLCGFCYCKFFSSTVIQKNERMILRRA